MDRLQLTSWVEKLKISPVEILREEIELMILDKLSQSPLGSKLIFKGGTALRLCYGSPRYSQDLDFNQKSKIKADQFYSILTKLNREIEGLKVKDYFDKRYTLFALLNIISPFLKQSFSIKIEISKKKYELQKNDYLLMTAKSQVSPLTPILYTYSLERILYEKKIAIKTRQAPRDYFDIWYISQKLGKKISLPKPKINPSQFKGELNQLLPNYLRNWSADFLSHYE